MKKNTINLTQPFTIDITHFFDKQLAQFEEGEFVADFVGPLGVPSEFVNEDIDKIVDLVEDKVIDLIQLHGDEDKEYIIKLRDALSTKQIDAKIIKAIRVKSGDNVKEILMRNDLLIDDLLDENVQKNEKHNLSDKKRCFKNNYKLITQIDYI